MIFGCWILLDISSPLPVLMWVEMLQVSGVPFLDFERLYLGFAIIDWTIPFYHIITIHLVINSFELTFSWITNWGLDNAALNYVTICSCVPPFICIEMTRFPILLDSGFNNANFKYIRWWRIFIGFRYFGYFIQVCCIQWAPIIFNSYLYFLNNF